MVASYRRALGLDGVVKCGEVYGKWPGLDSSPLYEKRDLAVIFAHRSPVPPLA